MTKSRMAERIRNELQRKDVLTIEETAGLARVSERTVYNWITDGKLPAVKLCGKLLINKKDLFMSGIGRYGDISIKGLHTLSFVDLHILSEEMGAILSRYAEEEVQGVCDFAQAVLAELRRIVAGRLHHETLAGLQNQKYSGGLD